MRRIPFALTHLQAEAVELACERMLDLLENGDPHEAFAYDLAPVLPNKRTLLAALHRIQRTLYAHAPQEEPHA